MVRFKAHNLETVNASFGFDSQGRNKEKLVIVIIKVTSIYVGSTPTFLTLQKMAKWFTRQTGNLFNHFISFIKYSLLIFIHNS